MNDKKNFREYNQNQLFFTTLDLKKLIPAEHPAMIINEVVERLDLEKLYKYYSNEGNPAYHPKLQLKIIFYGYYTGNMSCRKIWENVVYRADFMYLAGGEVPDFRTINSFIICPEGYIMEFKGVIKKDDKRINLYRGNHCDKCLKHKDCTKMKFRQIQIDTRVKYQDKMREKLDTDRGRLIYSKRSGIVENVHGDDQKNRGWIQHHLRRLFKADAEFIFIRISTNLRKIVNYGSEKLYLIKN